MRRWKPCNRSIVWTLQADGAEAAPGSLSRVGCEMPGYKQERVLGIGERETI